MPNYVSIFPWVSFVVAVSLLVPILFNRLWFLGAIYAIVLVLIFFILLQLERQRKAADEMNSLREEMSRSRLNETKRLVGEFSTEMKLEGYKKVQEKKFREISKKVLELDNKYNERFDLLGKAVVKLSKEKKD